MTPAGTTAPEAVTSADLATLPLRIEISKRAQWQEGEGGIRMVSAASIYLLPRGNEKPVLLLGPVGVPDDPEASWPTLLRCIADAIELEAGGPKLTPPHEPTECNNTKCPACLEIVKLRAEAATRCRECGKDAPFDGGAEGRCECCGTCTTTATGGTA